MLYLLFLLQPCYYCTYICIHADRLLFNLLRAYRLTLIDTSIDGIRVLCCHLPEGVLDDNGGVVADSQLQKENPLPLAGAQKILVPLCHSVPALVLYEGIVAEEVHRHRLAAVRANRKKLGRDSHILLPLDHFTDHGFVIKGLLTARLTALEQAVIALRVEQPLFCQSQPSESSGQRSW